jgi:TetR/AcrR family transcriptional repressor of nem operon
MGNPTPDAASFRDWVARRQHDAGPRRKGERTRDRIRLAAVELLNEVGYRQMKVSDVCQRAGVTPPVLYLYFENKVALTANVLEEFLNQFMAASADGAGRTAYAAIHQANLQWVSRARANAGLMRCLLDLSEDEPEFGVLFARVSHTWYQRIAESVVRRFPEGRVERAAIELVVYALGGMIDELTRKLFTSRAPDVVRLVGRVAPTDAALAEFLSVLWYRALYGADPTHGVTRPVTPRLLAAARKRRSA